MKVTARFSPEVQVEFESEEDASIFIANFADSADTFATYYAILFEHSATIEQFQKYRARSRDLARIMKTIKTTDGRYLKDVLKK